MTKQRTLPGDLNHNARLDVNMQDTEIAQMIRVNHAGEYGAQRIYKGQIAVLGDDPECGPLLRHMAEQEDVHLEYFDKSLQSRKVRPTVFQPLWHVGGYALGYVTAKMGKRAAMACTVAVEDVISSHYGEQLYKLDNVKTEPELQKTIAKFKAEEEEHHDIGIENEAEMTKGYNALFTAVQSISKAAIFLSKRF